MIHLSLQPLIAWLLVSFCSAASTLRYESHFHQHSGSDLDHVQCHHTEYKISPEGGTPELVKGQESRVEPSRQYLPQLSVKKEEEDPAASFDQPNVVPIDKSLISPVLQKNYNSLFSQKNKQDTIFPSAAQNVPSNVLPPVAPRITSDKKHSHEDDENNLERLCNDAFHSFLCKPITGPRKTPTGRLRPNAVIPPDVLAGLSSSQDARRVRPDSPETPSASNAVSQKYLPPSQPQPSNQIPQNALFSKPTTTTTRKPQTAYLPPAPFENILKNDKSDIPEIPSPSNTNSHVIKPQQHPHDCEKNKPFAAPVVASPSNDNSLFLKPISPSTPKPFPKYFNVPTTTVPTYSFPNIYQPSRTIVPPHDCDKAKHTEPHFDAKPSNNNPFLINPYSVPTQKPLPNFYNKPTISRPTENYTKAPQYKPSSPDHDCDKHKQQSYFDAKPTNNKPAVVKPYTLSTQPPPSSIFSTKSYFTNDFSKSASISQFQTVQPSTQHDCGKHTFPAFGAKTVPNTIAPKPYSQPSSNQFFRATTETPKQPQPSNNVPQIVAQPQQINTVTVSPKGRGYFYDKPAVQFRSPFGSPTYQNPSIAPLPTQSSPTTNGYSYDQPRVPFPSDNVARIVPQPAQQIPAFKGFTTTAAPCAHHGHSAQSSPVISNPTNQDVVVVRPSPYLYNKPDIPFPPERTGSSDQNPVSLRPVETSTGYNYDRPDTPFLLPNPTNNKPSIVASPASNGYTYNIPERQFPSPTDFASSNNQIFSNAPQPSSTQRPSYSGSSKGYFYEQPKEPFPTSINSKLALASDTTSNFVAKPQNQVEVKVKPGYSYDRPSEPLETPQASNDNKNVGYSYPRPGTPFNR